MAPPSQLAIATSSVKRLLKEEQSYHKEQAQQEARIQKLQGDISGENAEYQLKQEQKALEETKAVFGPLRNRIADAASRLEEQIAAASISSDHPEGLTEAQEVFGQTQAER
ncbi:MAG: hypothetical protein M1828_006893 [Chrysothrix sp. TS-e1954]|nr:MAG: hypothetical protein M1828_006893 [Chrysothrix sp. TS-e1954]